MESTGIIIIIHLQISVILFHDFFNTLDSEAMSALICFMGYRKSILIIHRGASAGIYEYDNNKKVNFLFFSTVSSIKESGMLSADSNALSNKLQNNDVKSCW